MKAPILAAVLLLTGAGGAAAADKPAASTGGASLIDAARQDDRARALGQIRRHADVNQTADDGSTALLWAVHNDDALLARALIAAGADVKMANAFGATPMSEAATNGDVTVLKALLDAGADVESPSAAGQTSLMIVARTANVQAASLLLDHGAKVDAAETIDHQTALMWAANERQGAMARLLIAHGADVNARSRVHDNDPRVTAEPRVRYDPSGGMTPLMFAAREGCVDCVKALVEAGTRIDAYDPDNITPLIFAVWNGHFDAASYLIKAGADVNRWDFWGRTALWAAVDFDTLPRGGRPDRPSVDDTTPLDLIKQLLAAGANPNALLKFAPPFRDAGADRGGDLVLYTGSSILLRAANGGDAEAVKLLLAAGALPNLAVAQSWRDPSRGGMTPLMVGAGLHNQPIDTRGRLRSEAQAVETVKLLIAAHADINAQDARGNTALMGAVYRGWNEVARVLIDAGADPYLANKAGLSPYDVAKGKPSGAHQQVLDIKADTAALIERLKPQAALKMASTDAKTKP
jgi:ankyrin repeat protein